MPETARKCKKCGAPLNPEYAQFHEFCTNCEEVQEVVHEERQREDIHDTSIYLYEMNKNIRTMKKILIFFCVLAAIGVIGMLSMFYRMTAAYSLFS